MGRSLGLLLSSLCLLVGGANGSTGKNIVGYFSLDNGMIDQYVKDDCSACDRTCVDPSLFPQNLRSTKGDEAIVTHLQVGFAWINKDAPDYTSLIDIIEDPYDEHFHAPACKRKAALEFIVDRAHGSGIKAVISIGGWAYTNDRSYYGKKAGPAGDLWDFSNTPNTYASRIREYVNEVAPGGGASRRLEDLAKGMVHFMDLYNFDGIDIDWEYPGSPFSTCILSTHKYYGGSGNMGICGRALLVASPTDESFHDPKDPGTVFKHHSISELTNFVRLLQRIKAQPSWSSIKILSMAAPGSPFYIVRMLPMMPEIIAELTFASLMLYDFAGQWDVNNGYPTAFSSPLFATEFFADPAPGFGKDAYQGLTTDHVGVGADTAGGGAPDPKPVTDCVNVNTKGGSACNALPLGGEMRWYNAGVGIIAALPDGMMFCASCPGMLQKHGITDCTAFPSPYPQVVSFAWQIYRVLKIPLSKLNAGVGFYGRVSEIVASEETPFCAWYDGCTGDEKAVCKTAGIHAAGVKQNGECHYPPGRKPSDAGDKTEANDLGGPGPHGGFGALHATRMGDYLKYPDPGSNETGGGNITQSLLAWLPQYDKFGGPGVGSTVFIGPNGEKQEAVLADSRVLLYPQLKVLLSQSLAGPMDPAGSPMTPDSNFPDGYYSYAWNSTSARVPWILGRFDQSEIKPWERKYSFITYEDADSIAEKIRYFSQNFGTAGAPNEFGGFMYWSMQDDDEQQTLGNTVFVEATKPPSPTPYAAPPSYFTQRQFRPAQPNDLAAPLAAQPAVVDTAGNSWWKGMSRAAVIAQLNKVHGGCGRWIIPEKTATSTTPNSGFQDQIQLTAGTTNNVSTATVDSAAGTAPAPKELKAYNAPGMRVFGLVLWEEVGEGTAAKLQVAAGWPATLAWDMGYLGKVGMYQYDNGAGGFAPCDFDAGTSFDPSSKFTGCMVKQQCFLGLGEKPIATVAAGSTAILQVLLWDRGNQGVHSFYATTDAPSGKCAHL